MGGRVDAVWVAVVLVGAGRGHFGDILLFVLDGPGDFAFGWQRLIVNSYLTYNYNQNGPSRQSLPCFLPDSPGTTSVCFKRVFKVIHSVLISAGGRV